MASVTIDVPQELIDEIGSLDTLAAQAQRALVLDLLREGRLSQGRAARLLGLTRYDILDLMAEHRIVSGPLTAEEVDRDLEAARRGMVAAPDDAGG